MSTCTSIHIPTYQPHVRVYVHMRLSDSDLLLIFFWVKMSVLSRLYQFRVK